MAKYDPVGTVYRRRKTNWGEVLGGIVALIFVIALIGSL